MFPSGVEAAIVEEGLRLNEKNLETWLEGLMVQGKKLDCGGARVTIYSPE